MIRGGWRQLEKVKAQLATARRREFFGLVMFSKWFFRLETIQEKNPIRPQASLKSDTSTFHDFAWVGMSGEGPVRRRHIRTRLSVPM